VLINHLSVKLLLLALPLALLFYFFPSIDIYVSSLFYSDHFYLKNQFFIKLVYDITHPMLYIFLFTSLFLLLLSLILKKELFFPKKAYLFLTLSILMAPGLVVNVILKDNVDRARPHHIQAFGGDKIFTPAFVVSDQCEKNCSFVCGHASAGFSFIALALLFTGTLRHRIMLGAIVLGFGIGLVRIVQGGHFLSDVIFSFFFCYFTIVLLHKWMFREERS
jgi:lipid A 4'-phosphatase